MLQTPAEKPTNPAFSCSFIPELIDNPPQFLIHSRAVGSGAAFSTTESILPHQPPPQKLSVLFVDNHVAGSISQYSFPAATHCRLSGIICSEDYVVGEIHSVFRGLSLISISQHAEAF
jgi:hypothetical protein